METQEEWFEMEEAAERWGIRIVAFLLLFALATLCLAAPPKDRCAAFEDRGWAVRGTVVCEYQCYRDTLNKPRWLVGVCIAIDNAAPGQRMRTTASPFKQK